MTPKISIAIPIYDTPKTAFFLSRLFKSLSEQTFTDYEIVVTNNIGMAYNHNQAILQSKGELIKLLQMDDYFAHPDALKDIIDNFKGEWMITACAHTDGKSIFNPHQPVWTDNIITGNNRLGGVSTLTIRNETKMLFDERLTWVVDCQLYRKYYDTYGPPTILYDTNVIIDVGDHRLSSTLSQEVKRQEVNLLIQEYAAKTI